jgi:hypothetical protein
LTRAAPSQRGVRRASASSCDRDRSRDPVGRAGSRPCLGGANHARRLGITPAGRLILNPTPDGAGLTGPWAVKISPDGRWALVTSSGSATKRETVEMYDIGTEPS